MNNARLHDKHLYGKYDSGLYFELKRIDFIKIKILGFCLSCRRKDFGYIISYDLNAW